MAADINNLHKTDQIRVLFVCHAGMKIGLGHLTRMIAVSQSLKIKGVHDFQFLVFGEAIKRSDLGGEVCTFISEEKDISSELLRFVRIDPPKVIVFDLHPKYINRTFESLFSKLLESKFYLVGVDSLFNYADILDLTWIPSFMKPSVLNSCAPKSLKFGWDTYLIQKRQSKPSWQNGNKVLVLTGGSDFTGLGKMLPSKIDSQLSGELEIHWVQGPFAIDPNLPVSPRLKWVIHKSVESLDALIVNCNYAITVFGVSFFELLQYGTPTVVFSPYDGKDDIELSALEKENVTIVSKNDETAVKDLMYLMENEKLAISLSQNALSKFSVNGANNLAGEIISILESK